MNAQTIKEETAQVEKWLKEGKTLATHTPSGPPFAKGKSAGILAQAEAAGMKLEGAIRRLFVREREEGWIAAGQFENVTEQGLLDELITPLTGGLIHGPGAGSTTYNRNPATGKLETEPHASLVENAEKSLPSWGAFALKVLVNSALLIVGIVLIIAGVLLAIRPSTPAGAVP